MKTLEYIEVHRSTLEHSKTKYVIPTGATHNVRSLAPPRVSYRLTFNKYLNGLRVLCSQRAASLQKRSPEESGLLCGDKTLLTINTAILRLYDVATDAIEMIHLSLIPWNKLASIFVMVAYHACSIRPREMGMI